MRIFRSRWSLGCLAFELISGNTPWDDDGVGCPYGTATPE